MMGREKEVEGDRRRKAESPVGHWIYSLHLFDSGSWAASAIYRV